MQEPELPDYLAVAFRISADYLYDTSMPEDMVVELLCCTPQTPLRQAINWVRPSTHGHTSYAPETIRAGALDGRCHHRLLRDVLRGAELVSGVAPHQLHLDAAGRGRRRRLPRRL